MMSHERFGEIRSMLHSEPPSEQLWKRLTGLLWGWREHLPQEMMAEYCNDLLVDWPDELRVLPKSWLKGILRGEQEPLFRLCRAVLVANRHISLDKLALILGCGTLDRVSILDLSNNDFAHDNATWSDWIDLLKRAPMFTHLRKLALRETRLTPDILDELRSVDLRDLRALDLTSNYQLDRLPDLLAGELGPTRLDLLALHNVVASHSPHDPNDNLRNPVYRHMLRTPGLRHILLHTPVAHLDVTGCRIDPLPLMDEDALNRLETLTCTINDHEHEWARLWGVARFDALAHVRITSMVRVPFTDQLDALCERIKRGDTSLRSLGLPSSTMRYAVYRDKYAPFFEAHQLAVSPIGA